MQRTFKDKWSGLGEWFDGISPAQVRVEANRWAHFTLAAYINRWNKDAAAVLSVLSSISDEELKAMLKLLGRQHGGGKSAKRQRSSYGHAVGSTLPDLDDDERVL